MQDYLNYIRKHQFTKFLGLGSGVPIPSVGRGSAPFCLLTPAPARVQQCAGARFPEKREGFVGGQTACPGDPKAAQAARGGPGSRGQPGAAREAREAKVGRGAAGAARAASVASVRTGKPSGSFRISREWCLLNVHIFHSVSHVPENSLNKSGQFV